jgi:OmpA-OmpF porin, OOP family
MNKPFRNIATALVAAAGLAGLSGAQAQSTAAQNSGGPFAMNSTYKGYIGLNAGQTDYRLSNGLGLFSSDNRANSYSLTGGAYFTNNLGVELGYTDFGTINRAGGTSRADAFSVSLVGKLPLAPSFNLLGKVGTSYGRTEVSAAPGSGVTPGSDSGFGLLVGVGAEYMFTPNWSVLLQYDAHDLRFIGGSSDRERVGVASLGVRYSF